MSRKAGARGFEARCARERPVLRLEDFAGTGISLSPTELRRVTLVRFSRAMTPS